MKLLARIDHQGKRTDEPCITRESSTVNRSPSLEILTWVLGAKLMQRKSWKSCLAELDTAVKRGRPASSSGSIPGSIKGCDLGNSNRGTEIGGRNLNIVRDIQNVKLWFIRSKHYIVGKIVPSKSEASKRTPLQHKSCKPNRSFMTVRLFSRKQ